MKIETITKATADLDAAVLTVRRQQQGDVDGQPNYVQIATVEVPVDGGRQGETLSASVALADLPKEQKDAITALLAMLLGQIEGTATVAKEAVLAAATIKK